VKNEAFVVLVGDEEVAAAAEDECLQHVLFCIVNCLGEVMLGGDGAEVARGAADTEGGIGGESDAVLD
jgi:hypothetical protein